MVGVAEIFHVNFHTFESRPAFLDEERAAFLHETLQAIVDHHGITCFAWSVMPTHVHCILVAFPDQPRAQIVKLLKGASARAFIERYPEWRAEVGDQLWQEGYHWVQIATQIQMIATMKYVNNNRPKIGLSPVPNQERRGEPGG